jgi:hypothetical protein
MRCSSDQGACRTLEPKLVVASDGGVCAAARHFASRGRSASAGNEMPICLFLSSHERGYSDSEVTHGPRGVTPLGACIPDYSHALVCDSKSLIPTNGDPAGRIRRWALDNGSRQRGRMARLAGAGREAMTAPRRVNRVETPDPEE